MPEYSRHLSFLHLLLFVVSVLWVPMSAEARIWNVNTAGTGDAPTIQAAIDSAASGDEIIVAPGRYSWSDQGHTGDYGMIYFATYVSGFTLRSSDGPEVTILDASFQGRVMFIQGHNDIVVDGFTFTNGVGPVSYDAGGGLIGHLADPVIRNCVFKNNSAHQGGGLWFGGVSSPTIEDCIFYGNSAYYGGGVCLVNSSGDATIRRCVIRDNEAEARGGGLTAHNYRFRIEYSAVCGNLCEDRGGALSVSGYEQAEVFRCTISRNGAPDGGSIQLQESAEIDLTCSIVAFGRRGGAISLWDGTSINVENCVLWQNAGGDSIPVPGTGTGNYVIDPQFCGSPDSGNWLLQSDSPCLPSNHPVGLPCLGVGAYQGGCGEVSARTSTWGSIRRMNGK